MHLLRKTILTLLVVLAVLSSCKEEEESVPLTKENQEALIRGNQQYKAGNVDKALSELLKIPEDSPVHKQSSYLSGKIYYSLDDYPKAISAFNSSLEENSCFFEGKLWLTKSFLANEQFNKAQTHLNELFKNYPNDPRTAYTQAQLYYSQKRFTKALEYYERASLIEEDLITILLDKARVYYHIGFTDKAYTEITKAHVLVSSDSTLFPAINSLKKRIEAER